MTAAARYLVTTTTGSRSQTREWSAHQGPLALGHPFRFVLSRAEGGRLELRSLAGESEGARSLGARGGELALSRGLKLRVRAVSFPTPVSASDARAAVVAATLERCSIATPTTGEEQELKRALAASLGALAFILMLTWVWPAPKEDPKELIPAQFAKIILAKPKTETSAGSPDAGGNHATATKARDTSVAQAFRAKALQNSMSALLKGGMTKLLAQSDFVAGRGASAEARTMFNTKSQGLQALAPQTGVTNEKNIAIASLGGEAKGDQAGYGKGSHAGVQGQGSGQVSLDAQGAAVEEGLTKDEVGEVIHKHLGEIRYCYESAMIRSPDVEGKLMVNFSIGGTGVVRSSEVASSSLSDPRLDDCILRRLSTWKFPEPRGHVTVAVSYPFIFKSLGR